MDEPTWGFTIKAVGRGRSAEAAWSDARAYLESELHKMDVDDAEPMRLG
jgi:hypothetical protein